MATIPVFKESQRLAPSNPTGFQSTTSARIRGEAISSFGQGVAQFGTQLHKLQQRQNSAERTLAQSDFKNAMTKKLQDLNAEILNNGKSGAEDTADYDKKSSDALNGVLKEFDKKYSGKYGNEFNITGNGLINGVRIGIMTNGLAKQKNFLATGIDRLTSQFNKAAITSPETIQETLTDYTTSIGGVTTAMGASETVVAGATFAGHRGLVDSAVDGYIQKGKYKEATELVIGSQGHLYNQEGTEKTLKKIRDRKLDAENIKFREDKRAQDKLDASHKEIQAHNLGLVLTQFSKTKDPKVRNKIMEQAVSMMKSGDLAINAWGKINAGETASQKQDSAISSFGLSEDFGNATTEEQLGAMKIKIKDLLANDHLTPERAEYWNNKISAGAKQNKLNPRVRNLIKIGRNRLSEITGTYGMFEKMEDQMEGGRRTRRKIRTENMYDSLIAAHGDNPSQEQIDTAVFRALTANFEPLDSIGLYPKYERKISNRDDLKDFVKWAQYNVPVNEIPRVQLHIDAVQSALSIEEVKKATGDFRTESAAQKVLEQNEETLDIDALMEMPEGERPLIFRR